MHETGKSVTLVKKNVAEICSKSGKSYSEIYRMIQEESNGQV